VDITRFLVALMTFKLCKLLLALIGLTVVMGCTRTPKWTLFYIADKTVAQSISSAPVDLIQTEFIAGYYDSLAQCQAKGAGMLRLQASSMPAAQAFVCAQQCQIDDKQQLHCTHKVIGAELDAL
jgi:hypothetical protein